MADLAGGPSIPEPPGRGSLRLALVGPDQQDNLALGYLASAAAAAGHQASMVRFNTRADLDRTVSAVLATKPDVVGLGVPFQSTIGDYLDLARALRLRGFRGHLTCGGHVPTFSFRELLDESPDLDSAVRHEGEATLVELLDRLARAEPIGGVRGLVHRGEGGALIVEPARPLEVDLARLAPPRRRWPPLSVGGVPIAFLISSRGCVGDCAYCSIRAFNRDAGGPRFRLRPVDDVAEEVLGLRRRGVRVFFLQDDLFLLPSEAKTLARLEALGEALAARGVDDGLFWIKGRPESITAEVVSAARALGALHLFIGVESASARQLAYLGRTHGPEDNLRAIARCRAAGVLPSFNFMLFDPEGTLDDVSRTLALAEANLDLPWNVCRTEIYPGTRLLSRLRDQGRLEGDWRSYGYRIADEGAEILFRVMRVSFHERAFTFDSLLNRLISLSFARQVHSALFPSPVTSELDRAIEALVVEVHGDTVSRARRALDFASTASLTDIEAVQAFAVEEALSMGVDNARWYARFDELWDHLNRRGESLLRARAG